MDPSVGQTSFPAPGAPTSAPAFAASTPSPSAPIQPNGVTQAAASSGIPTATDNPPAGQSPDVSTPTVNSGSSGGGRRRRIIMIAIALVLMLGGLASGTYLLTRQQIDQSFAWDCATYGFDVDESGIVTVLNGSTRDLPAQVAVVYIDGQQVAEFEVPALDSGSSASLGVVPVPEDGRFEWRVIGNKDCEDTGSFLPDSVAQCLNVKAFDEEWEPLTQADLSSYEAGDVVRFSIGGITNKGTFDSARFTVNGEVMDPIQEKRPGTDEFYYEYEIPEDVEGFTVTAELMHSEAGWIGK